MKRLSCFLLLFYVAIALPAQPYRVVSGLVIEAGTEKPIPFATLRLQGLAFGTVSNEQGEFELKIPPAYQHLALELRCVGYRLQTLAPAALGRDMRIRLETEETLLLGVQIQALSAESILRKALEAVPTNYLHYQRKVKYTIYEHRTNYNRGSKSSEYEVLSQSVMYAEDECSQIIKSRARAYNDTGRREMREIHFSSINCDFTPLNWEYVLKKRKRYKVYLEDILVEQQDTIYRVCHHDPKYNTLVYFDILASSFAVKKIVSKLSNQGKDSWIHTYHYMPLGHIGCFRTVTT